MKEVAQSLGRHIQDGGWRSGTPLRLPSEGSEISEDAVPRNARCSQAIGEVKDYVAAKQRQAHFDLVSAALIYVSHNSALAL